MLEFFERHLGQRRRVVDASLRQFNNLQRHDSRRRILSQFDREFGAYRFERERHLPDHFRFKCLARKESPYWHGALDIADSMELCAIKILPWLRLCPMTKNWVGNES
jgi:hypothetical protein